MSYDEDALLLDLIGQDYNNFDEPVPASNHPPLLRGLVASFLVVGRYLFTFYLTNGFLNLAAAFIKLSLLCQYLRVFDRLSLPYKLSLFGIVVVSLWGVAFAILAFFPCSTVSDFWYSPPDARCWAYGSSEASHFTATFIAHSVLNMVLDLYILAIPTHLFFQSQSSSKTRFGLLALFFLGAVVTFLSGWRLQTIIQYQAGWYPTHDPTWYGPISILLGVLEVHVASACASIPIFWPIISPYLHLGGIFVTHEVSVQVQDHSDSQAIIDRKDKAPSRHASTWNSSDNGQTISETELLPISEQNTNPHYNNKFVAEQVDPFRTTQAQTSLVRSNSNQDNRKWYKV
ncbi:unnamed protein product [Clonostachys rosea]|uniref:Rhodopsin domain-containing protein n=1 Tax=Bionectria ochroleuca TaxID=29856 RepID=A0ABY6UW79_BIOOC|nr:unnamed protein product [Clonostachys rosea]